MHSPTERDESEFTGGRPGGNGPGSPRTQLKVLAVISVLTPVLAMASAGSLPWYTITAFGLILPTVVAAYIIAVIRAIARESSPAPDRLRSEAR